MAKETAFAAQKRDLVAREVAALRAEFTDKQTQLDAAAARERDELHAALDRRSRELDQAHQEKLRQIEAAKSHGSELLLEKEEELAKSFQKLEHDLRNELNLTKIEHAAAHDEKLRKLAEDRAALQKQYETRLRELEARYRKGGAGA